MKDKKISKIIDKIKTEDIKPFPKWKTNFSNYIYWVLLVLLLMIGGALASLAIINYLDVLPEIARHLNLGKFMFVMIKTIPFLWVILLMLSLFFGVLAYRGTKNGYRHSMISIITLLVLVISILCFASHISRVNKRMEGFIERRMPPRFNHFDSFQENRFLDPSEGLITGRVVELVGNNFIIKNRRQEWEVRTFPDTKIRSGEMKGMGVIWKDASVVVVGEPFEEEVFDAKVVIIKGAAKFRKR